MEDRNNEILEMSSEKKKELSDRAMARQVVHEILNFGVTDNQTREIIKQLALELENRDTMLKIFEFLGEPQESVQSKIYT